MSTFKVTIKSGDLLTKVNKAYSVDFSRNKSEDFIVIHALSPCITTKDKDNLMEVCCDYINDGIDHHYYEIVIPNKNIEYVCVYAKQ